MMEFYDLRIWQDAKEVYLQVYRITRHPCLDFDVYVRNQLRRAAFSVGLNISEGKGRGSAKQYRQFLIVARGSLEEVHSGLLIAREQFSDLEIPKELFDQIIKLKGSISALIMRVERSKRVNRHDRNGM